MSHPAEREDSLIALDWGTSQLRAYRLDASGGVREQRSRPWGVRHLPDGSFDGALAGITDGWPQLPRVACGMVGSRNGWMEAPYVEVPAGAIHLAAGVQRLRAADGLDVHIVPGLRQGHGPDVMRGEETQIIGALALHPELGERSNWILPGTHSKWARVVNGVVVDFCTLMTGELFGLLWRHSILGTGAHAGNMDAQAFDRGVLAARDSGEQGALSRLFSARALMLEGRLEAAGVADYLSGLLIGEEFRSSLSARRFPADTPFQLIGDVPLCERYRRAARHFDIELPDPIADAAAHGLWQLAMRIGLVPQAATKDSLSC
ncbi:2-dehydro-3-deoxygalactonokinase [Dyella sp. C9]|uniref:2-dehydro-3-deoxygalactonokinase n=1 Tax=Dyella sp. C9 TaxID=2202154 RepID=UPI0018E5436E|nr:2-dehydro-3-deoxygalactonokinase [Dyella sp. C9]